LVVTTAAFSRLMSTSGQAAGAAALESVLEQEGREALEEACERVREAILNTAPPPEVLEAMSDACQACFGASPPPFAVRSSAVGEDTAASHAGQYLTRLGVQHEDLPNAWREVVASAFRPDVVLYRYLRGIPFEQAAMAVLVLSMVRPRAAGVLFTRDMNAPERDAVAIAITGGPGDALVSGRTDAIELRLHDDEEILGPMPAEFVRPSDLAELREAARRLEGHFGGPQDVEWAVEDDGPVYFLQSRPLALAPIPDGGELDAVVRDVAGAGPVIEGGQTACPGIGIGPVCKLTAPDLPGSAPAGSVLVARNAVVELARFMPSCAALITEVGSPTSHLAILTRECGLPALVGVPGAFDRLSDGQTVTVDATRRRVFPGALPVKGGRPDARGRVSGAAPLENSPAVRRLRQLAEWVAPLHLTDPAAPEFAPGNCRSLHDLTRFVHENIYRVMFGFGEAVQRSLPAPQVLEARLPMAVHLFDAGGGLQASTGARIPPSAIRSEPMQAFVRGLRDPRIAWDRPRAISAGGFLSVVGESLTVGGAAAEAMAEASFAVVSANYMNFAIRAGYHFSTIDTWSGRAENRNYIHFHFSGGGAGSQRRERRQRFLARVLGELRFDVRCRGDILRARLDKFGHEQTLATLERLGQLTLCTRQLDMLMDSEAHVEDFASAFLQGDLARF
jgi:pyruvate,water dikinase